MLAAVGRPMQTSAQSWPGSSPGMAVDVEDPFPVRRPARAEVEVARLRGDPDPIRAVEIAGPDLVALRAGQMEGDALSVRAQAQAIGQPFAGAA